jgi:hypothetical protein
MADRGRGQGSERPKAATIVQEAAGRAPPAGAGPRTVDRASEPGAWLFSREMAGRRLCLLGRAEMDGVGGNRPGRNPRAYDRSRRRIAAFGGGVAGQLVLTWCEHDMASVFDGAE